MVDLNRSLGTQFVDLNRLAASLREKDQYGNDQVYDVVDDQAFSTKKNCQ